MPHTRRERGFTLVELMLAMVFVAFILVFISLTLVQMFRTYDKGSSMKQVNQAGRSVIEELGQAVRSQLPANIDTDAVGVGVLCVDRVLYVWNPLYVGGVQVPATPLDNHRSVIGAINTGGMMARKVMSGAGACPSNLADALDTSVTPVSEETQLLSSQTRVLSSTATRVDARLIKLDMVIGTYSRSEILGGTTRYITATRQPDGSFACLPGNDGNYCSFATFSQVVYVSKE